MATVVNTPASTTGSDSSMGFLLGAVLLIVFLFALFYYGIPMIGRAGSAPSAGSSSGAGAEINIPEQVDVNVGGDTPQQSTAPAQ